MLTPLGHGSHRHIVHALRSPPAMSEPPPPSADLSMGATSRARRPLGLQPDLTLCLSLLCALIVHVLGLFTLSQVGFARRGTGSDMILSVDVEKLLPPKFSEPMPKPIDTRPREPVAAAKTPAEPVAPADMAPLAPAALADAPAGPNPSALDMDAAPEKTALAAEGGDKFVGFIRELRARGMDVIFVFDSTTSMEDVIGEVKRNVSRMTAVLHALVPECRLGVVTYRDKGADYVTRRRDLTPDRDAVLSFVNSIEVGLGRNAWNVEDWPEAVCQGLADAVHNDWRPQARKAIILIGDAPPPKDEEGRTLDLAARFRRTQRGIIHTIYVRTVSAENMRASPRVRSDDRAVAAKAARYSLHIRQFYRKLALAGGGEALRLTSGDEVVRHLVTLAFGMEWTGNIRKIYDRAGVQ